MSATERRKGATYERELVREAKAHGLGDADRTSKGKVQIGGDLAGIPTLAIEAKRCETITMPAWLRQAQDQATDGLAPAVAFRRSGEQPWPDVPEKSWLVVPWGWALDMMAEVQRLRALCRDLEGEAADFSGYMGRQ